MILGSSASLTVEELDGYFASNAVEADDCIWVAVGGDSNYSQGIAQIDPQTGTVDYFISVGIDAIANTLVTDGTYIFFIQEGDDLRRYNASNPSAGSTTLSISYPAVDGSYGGGSLWVVENAPSPQILKVNPSTFTLEETFIYEDYTEFKSIFHDGTYLWAISDDDRELIKVNTSDGSIIDTCSIGSSATSFFATRTSIAVSEDGYVVAAYRDLASTEDGYLLVAPVDDLSSASILDASELINEVSPLGDYWWAAFDQAIVVDGEIVLSFRHYFYPEDGDGIAGGVIVFDPATQAITSSVLVNDGYNTFNGTIFYISEMFGDIWFNHYSFNPPTNDLRYINALPEPNVSGVSPASGLNIGGNSVTISGANFTGATSVFFGATSASFTVESDIQITATAPSGNAGQVDVTVTSPNGTSATSSASKYTYVTAVANGGTSITISSGGGAASGAPLITSRNEAEEKNLTGPLAHPFRFVNGKIPKVIEGSDQFSAQRIASAASIGFNELPLRPIFGSNSPEFVGFDRGGFMLTCGSYFPDIRIAEAEEFIGNDGKGKIEIKFARNE
jgi:hypothetical protein